MENKINTSYIDGVELLDSDFTELDEFLDTEFLPNRIELEETENVDGESEYTQTISMKKIKELNLNDEEFEHVLSYLRSRNIKVNNQEDELEEEFASNDFSDYSDEEYPQLVPSIVTEKNIAKYRENQDEKLREQIFVDNMELVKFYAKKYAQKTGLSPEELESFGYEGLLYAIDSHDEEYKNTFIAYATKCIRGTIVSSISRKEKSTSDKYYYPYIVANNQLKQEKEAAYERTDVTPQTKVDRMFEMEEQKKNPFQIPRDQLYRSYDSYKEDVGDRIKIYQDEMRSYSDEDELNDMLDTGELRDYTDYTERSNNYELAETMEQMLDTIQPEEKEVLKTRFGFIDGSTKTIEETSEIVGREPHEVMRMENKGLRKLIRPHRARFLYDFYSNSTNERYDEMNQRALQIEREEKEHKKAK